MKQVIDQETCMIIRACYLSHLIQSTTKIHLLIVIINGLQLKHK